MYDWPMSDEDRQPEFTHGGDERLPSEEELLEDLLQDISLTPEENERMTQSVEFHAPCDVVFASGFDGESIDAVNVGSGGGPHHLGAIPLVRALGTQGADVHVIAVDPERLGSREDPGHTVAMPGEVEDLFVHNVTAPTVADGMVRKEAETGGILVIGASRDRRLRQWVFGSTPDRVVELAERRDVPILIYASAMDISTRLEDYVFPIYRYLRKYA
jgi:nucleotide-binding universal stress UspA family protein